MRGAAVPEDDLLPGAILGQIRTKRGFMRTPIRIALILAAGVACSPARWVNYRTPGIARTADGKPNLTAPAPRASDGKPDLSGLWQVQPSPWAELKPLVG